LLSLSSNKALFSHISKTVGASGSFELKHFVVEHVNPSLVWRMPLAFCSCAKIAGRSLMSMLRCESRSFVNEEVVMNSAMVAELSCFGVRHWGMKGHDS
jgi:hypothetical protein